MTSLKLLFVFVIVLYIPTRASAWLIRLDGTQRCPFYDPSVSWRDYISGKIPPPKDRFGNPCAGNPFGVQFRVPKDMEDPNAYGNLKGDACYTAIYVVQLTKSHSVKGFLSLRALTKGEERMQGLPGNPENYEINIMGTTLLFNDYGEVFDKRGRVVGLLVGYGTNELGK